LTGRGRQLVDDLDSLRDAIATDVLHDVADEKIKTGLDTLKDVKDRIKRVGKHSDNVAAK
jgi:DNA-binding MarR family transcriptional regulator